MKISTNFMLNLCHDTWILCTVRVYDLFVWCIQQIGQLYFCRDTSPFSLANQNKLIYLVFGSSSRHVNLTIVQFWHNASGFHSDAHFITIIHRLKCTQQHTTHSMKYVQEPQKWFIFIKLCSWAVLELGGRANQISITLNKDFVATQCYCSFTAVSSQW